MNEITYSIIGISIIFVCTTLGALSVFLFKNKHISPKLNKIFTGFAPGVMFSASFTSLILPAIETEVTYMRKQSRRYPNSKNV